MMKKLLLVCFLLNSVAFAQIYVPPGDGTLSQAILDAQDGDILELVPEGLYTETTNSVIGTVVNKNITIKTEGEDPVKATIQFSQQSEAETPVFFDLGDNASLTLQDLEFNGIKDGVKFAEYLIRFYMGEFPAPANIKSIRIQNCYIHNINNSVIVGGSSDMRENVVVDSTFIHNVIMENTGTSIYYKYNGADYIEIRNCTFNSISSYGLRIAGPGESYNEEHTPTVVINYTTWYNIGVGTDPREILQLEKGPNLNPWTVTNSIFAKQLDKGRTCLNLKDTTNDSLATVTNICLWDVGKRSWRSHTVQDTINMDPQFADPDNGDFTIPAGSPLLTFGSDGGPIGDRRWATNATAVEINNKTMPDKFLLGQNYPNPFNPSTMIQFNLEKTSHTILTVHNILGHEIETLVNDKLSAGMHQVSFDAKGLPSGIYFYRLKSAGHSQIRKMMLLQ